jgi:alanine dehydrogenase
VSDSRVLVLGHAAVDSLLTFDDVLEVVRDAFVALSAGEAQLFPMVRESLDDAFFGLRSAYWPSQKLLGLKTSGYFPANKTRGEPSHQASIVLVSPESGKPRAFLDGNQITQIRTAAAGVLGTSLLARTDARRILVIGNGHQAEAQIISHHKHLAERQPTFSVVAPRDDDAASKGRAFARRLAEKDVPVTVHRSLREAVSQAEIVITATPAREPLLQLEFVSPGTHITAMGSDTPGKRELDKRLVKAARVVVDDRAQSERYGECQDLDEPVDVAVLGDLIAGRTMGRQNDEEITVFDSTGIGLHDVVTAELAFRQALAVGAGAWITLD